MHPAKPGRRLDRVSGRTLLADRLRDELLEEITSSQLQPGTKLPSEGQLAKRFNVSRATVRDARSRSALCSKAMARVFVNRSPANATAAPSVDRLFM